MALITSSELQNGFDINTHKFTLYIHFIAVFDCIYGCIEQFSGLPYKIVVITSSTLPLLQVLGTGSGGTTEIIDHNVTGLLHPLGRPGARVLAKNFEFFLENPSARQEMGIKGREKVEKMYLKKHMFQKFGEVLYKCMRIK